jgi:hypothetical protein
MSGRMYGERVEGLQANGRPLVAGVFDERQVRAAAGLTMALGAVAFAYAFLAKEFLPIKIVTAFFLIEFAVRVSMGLRFSPVGQAARILTQRGEPQWVSAAPKRFAWSLGVVMAGAMTVITNANIRGLLPMSICLVCLTLMWLESVLGLCVGCQVYGLMVRRGWRSPVQKYEVCADGACSVDQPKTATDLLSASRPT